MSNDNIVIAGYSETKVEFRSGRSAYDFAGEVFAQLLENTGVEKDAVDESTNEVWYNSTLSEVLIKRYTK